MGDLFSTFGINGYLLLTQAVNFAVLLTALWYFLYKPVFKLLDERSRKIAEGVREAEAAKEKLREADSEKQSILKSANSEAEGIVSNAKEFAASKGDQMVRDAQAKSEALLAEAKMRAEEAKKKALQESEAEVARMAILAAEKVLTQKHG